MKYIKLFEEKELINGPEIGDYVLLDREELWYDDGSNEASLDNYLSTNLGLVIGFEDGWNTSLVDYKKSKRNNDMFYVLQYSDLPDKVKEYAYPYLGRTIDGRYQDNILSVPRDMIKFFGSDKEIELQKATIKYNL